MQKFFASTGKNCTNTTIIRQNTNISLYSEFGRNSLRVKGSVRFLCLPGSNDFFLSLADIQWQSLYDPLKQLLQSLAPFSEAELERALPFFCPAALAKHAFFNSAGRISGRLGFVVSGILRSFYILKGKETTTFFQLPGDIAVDLKSFVRMSPSIETIQAVTDAQLLVIEREDLYALYEEDWKWQQVGRVLVENAYFEMEERSIFLQTHSAHDRYERFLVEYPEVVRHTPLNQVASYLGISPETLSRIRKTI